MNSIEESNASQKEEEAEEVLNETALLQVISAAKPPVLYRTLPAASCDGHSDLAVQCGVFVDQRKRWLEWRSEL